MSRIGLVIGTLLVCSVTLASGWVHSKVTYDQHAAERTKVAGERLLKLPEAPVGEWEMASSQTLRPNAINLLNVSGYIMRTYVHRTRGWRVQVFVAVGPYGPISVHTPDVCYPANDYDVSSKAKLFTVRDASGAKQQLRGMNLRSRDSASQSLRAVYGWTRNGQWKAPSQPRLTFIGSPYLYKIQLAAPLDSAEQDKDRRRDPSSEFLQEFLPFLQEYLVS